MVNEDDVLLDYIEKKIDICLEKGIITYSDFLDMRQKALAEAVCRRSKELKYMFYGGYEEAERTVAVFIPDHSRLEDDNPLALIHITHKSSKALTHRDYLGSLLGLGIKREIIGDILVRNDGADIIVLKKMADFLLHNYDKAGSVNLTTEMKNIDTLTVPEQRFEEKRDTVASLRLDSVIASAFSLSRTSAAEVIREGRVHLNGLPCEKADRLVKEGDKLVLRGRGKVMLETVGAVTRKNRIVIIIKKYI